MCLEKGQKEASFPKRQIPGCDLNSLTTLESLFKNKTPDSLSPFGALKADKPLLKQLPISNPKIES